MSPRLASLAPLLLIACPAWVGAERPPPPEVAPAPIAARPPAPTEAAARRPDPKDRLSEPARTHLIALAHDPTSARGQALALALAEPGAPLTAGSPRALTALPLPRAPGRFRLVTAHAGQAAWAVASGDDGAFSVSRLELGGDATRSVAIGDVEPSALHGVGDVIFVGAGKRVGWIDFGEPSPTYQVAHERPEMLYKAYDLFVRAGDWLIAIDDEVTPIYADSFALDGAAHPAHKASWELPGVINGHYHAGALARTEAADGTLYLLASYGIMDGWGQDLVALSVVGDRLRVPRGLVVNSAASSEPPVLEEHVSRETGQPEKLVAGTTFTEWPSVSFYPGTDRIPSWLLAPAGERGLLLIPDRFTPQTLANAVALGAPCLDVIVSDERVFALVGGDAPAVLELERGGEALRERARTPLDRVYDRFVR
ncbi:MAG: hypothetical protein R3A51_09975 [Nannocystaceae bacterium]